MQLDATTRILKGNLSDHFMRLPFLVIPTAVAIIFGESILENDNGLESP
jgi:hypothetical protein